MTETRTCCMCKQIFPLTNEYFAQTGGKGDTVYHRKMCRDCFNRHNRDERAKTRTRVCIDCGKEYPLSIKYFAENYQHNGKIHLRNQCKECVNAKRRERRNGHPTPPRSTQAPDTYRVLAIDWHTMSLVKLEATVIEVVADISKLKTDDALNAIIRQQRELYPNILFAKNPAVKMEIIE